MVLFSEIFKTLHFLTTPDVYFLLSGLLYSSPPAMTLLHVITILVSAASFSIASTDCKIYQQLEEKAQCGEDGYLLQYGLKNCRSFTSKEVTSRFSTEGQEFLDCTNSCLTTHLQELFENGQPTCDDIYDSAMDSVAPCYIQCGFCKICKTEKMALARGHDFLDFVSVKSISTAAKVVWECGPMKCMISFF
ncbi:hypothetical protein Q1695_008410 [Nippostrongylus brasiliensis]|nr:hypothetical protein Q1695_008410 [Nippostrongylus brasiliensis]